MTGTGQRRRAAGAALGVQQPPWEGAVLFPHVIPPSLFRRDQKNILEISTIVHPH